MEAEDTGHLAEAADENPPTAEALGALYNRRGWPIPPGHSKESLFALLRAAGNPAAGVVVEAVNRQGLQDKNDSGAGFWQSVAQHQQTLPLRANSAPLQANSKVFKDALEQLLPKIAPIDSLPSDQVLAPRFINYGVAKWDEVGEAAQWLLRFCQQLFDHPPPKNYAGPEQAGAGGAGAAAAVAVGAVVPPEEELRWRRQLRLCLLSTGASLLSAMGSRIPADFGLGAGYYLVCQKHRNFKPNWDLKPKPLIALLKGAKAFALELQAQVQKRTKAETTIIADGLARISSSLDSFDSETFTVSFVGPTKSGKSTLVNAVVGQSFSPMQNEPMTAICVKFVHTLDLPGKQC